MFLDEYEKYIAHYEKGAKKISMRSSYPKVSTRENPSIKMEKSHGNFDLYFNRQGTLLHSIHFERENYRNVYTYDSKRKVVKIVRIKFENNILLEQSEFTYDAENRSINEVSNHYYYNLDSIDRSEIKNTYSGNTKISEMTSTEDED